jgi:hypothetical protein
MEILTYRLRRRASFLDLKSLCCRWVNIKSFVAKYNFEKLIVRVKTLLRLFKKSSSCGKLLAIFKIKGMRTASG